MGFAWGLWHTYYYASAQISTYDYESLISRVDQYCYTELVKNASCCMDQEFAEGVRKVTVKRPGTGWFCDKKLCYDDLKGHRGGGTMWIPHGATCGSPRVLYVHGGSWLYCSPETCSYPQLTKKDLTLS